MNEKEKKDELRRILPLAWSSYQHMYDTRAKNIENQINFLLIVVSFLPVISLMLFQGFDKNPIFLLPIMPQFIALIFLLKPFFLRWPVVHWFKNVNNETLKALEENNFDQQLFASLKGLEGITWKFQGIMKDIIKVSVYMILLSLYGIILAIMAEYLEFQFYLYLIIFILGISHTLIITFYIKQPDLLKEANDKIEKYTKQIKNWLKEK